MSVYDYLYPLPKNVQGGGGYVGSVVSFIHVLFVLLE